MRTMAVTGWIYLLTALLSLRCNVAHSHRGEADTYHVSAGHLFLLQCLDSAHTNVTWSRSGTQNQTLPSGVEVREGLLWFLPVQAAHNGTYTCENRDETGLFTFRVSVSTGDYPDPSEHISLEQEVSGGLPCKQTEILRLNHSRNIEWMKDHRPVTPFSVSEDGFMRLLKVSKEDAGKYTCLIHFSLDGKNYTSARSIQLSVDTGESTCAHPPIIKTPLSEVMIVEVDRRLELRCTAVIGNCMNDETFMYWTVGQDFVEDHKEITESFSFHYKNGKVIGESNLSISSVRRDFLNVPFNCNVCNPTGEDSGQVILQEADHSALYISVALCLSASLATLALAAATLCFKVDVVLAYRRLMRIFSKQAPDGKLYDAYVSYLHYDTPNSAQTASFALQLLPEKLEKKHGYSLFIRGRDDCPGEAVHDIISATLHQCRRLIIILSGDASLSNSSKSSNPDGKEVETSPLHSEQNHLCYEQKIGIYDALTQNEPRVILVEIGSPVDYSKLPESLHYIKKKQGSLKWKKSPETHKLIKVHSNRNFWKNLRYHMPPVPAGRVQTIV